MMELSYRRHRFPPVVIQHAVWLYLRFTLSYRDVEDLLAERGVDVSYETVRRWVLKFGPVIARRLRRRRPRASDRWHLDEMVVRIAGQRMFHPTSAWRRHLGNAAPGRPASGMCRCLSASYSTGSAPCMEYQGHGSLLCWKVRSPLYPRRKPLR